MSYIFEEEINKNEDNNNNTDESILFFFNIYLYKYIIHNI